MILNIFHINPTELHNNNVMLMLVNFKAQTQHFDSTSAELLAGGGVRKIRTHQQPYETYFALLESNAC